MKDQPTFEYFQGEDDKWYWVFKNRRTVLAQENKGHKTKEKCREDIDELLRLMSMNLVVKERGK